MFTAVIIICLLSIAFSLVMLYGTFTELRHHSVFPYLVVIQCANIISSAGIIIGMIWTAYGS